MRNREGEIPGLYINSHHLQHDFFGGLSSYKSKLFTFFGRVLLFPLFRLAFYDGDLSVFVGRVVWRILAISMKVFSTFRFSLALTLFGGGLLQRRHECLIILGIIGSMTQPLALRPTCYRSRRSLHLFCCYFVPQEASNPLGSACEKMYFEAVIAGEIIAEKNGIGAVVVCTDDGTEGLLT